MLGCKLLLHAFVVKHMADMEEWLTLNVVWRALEIDLKYVVTYGETQFTVLDTWVSRCQEKYVRSAKCVRSHVFRFFLLPVAANCKCNEMHSIVEIPFCTKHVHLNSKLQTPKYIRWKWQWFVCMHNSTNIMYLVCHVFCLTPKLGNVQCFLHYSVQIQNLQSLY